MTTGKHRRTIVELVREAGLRLLHGPVQTRGNHLRVEVETPGGDRRSYTMPLSPSDHRWLANARSDLRKIARGIW